MSFKDVRPDYHSTRSVHVAQISVANQRLLEKLFIQSGYVLDFSNATFADFFESEVGVNIYDPYYETNGTSKGNRLRAFLKLADPSTVARALRALWEYRRGTISPLRDEADYEPRIMTLIRELSPPDGNQSTAPMPVATPEAADAQTSDPGAGVAIVTALASYAHHDEAYGARVLGIVNRLRSDNIDCWSDHFESFPREGWPRWTERQLAERQWILVFASESYKRRADGKEQVGHGLGAIWEHGIIRSELYEAGKINERFIPVGFGPSQRSQVPRELRDYTYFDLDSESDYQKLLSVLRNKPLVTPHPLGGISFTIAPLVNAITAANTTTQDLSEGIEDSSETKSLKNQSNRVLSTNSERDADTAAPWTAFVGDWKRLDMSGLRSEQDVREEVLAPMLRMLGYGSGTVNNVLRAHPESLPREYRMVGSRRIEVDYVPTLRLQRFWIMEAKKPGGLNPDAFLQAHFYATYPTIAARYIVLADGEQLRVYDATATDFGAPRVVVSRETAERDFDALYQLLSARNIEDAIRRDVFRDVERLLAVETDTSAPRSFESEIAAIARRVKPIIAENARQLIVTKFRRDAEQRLSYLRSVDMRTLLSIMAHPTEVGGDTSNELARRMTEGDGKDRQAARRAALEAVERPARQTVRVGVMLALLKAATQRAGQDALDLIESGVALARANLSYAADSPTLNAAIHLENAVDRVSMKIVQSVMGERAAEAERLALRTMSQEDLLLDPPSRNYPLIMFASGLAANLWSGLQGPDADDVLKRVRAIERFERDYLAELPPRLVGDQIMFAYKGREFDFLIRATVDGLARIVDAAPGLLPQDLVEVAAGWGAHRFPPTPAIPDGDEDTNVRLAFEAMLTVLRQVADGTALRPPGETELQPPGEAGSKIPGG